MTVARGQFRKTGIRLPPVALEKERTAAQTELVRVAIVNLLPGIRGTNDGGSALRVDED